jgi:hypothetical protein
VAAVQDVLDISVDNNWGKYTHVTDSGILRQLIDVSGSCEFDSSIELTVKKCRRKNTAA